MKQFNIYGEIDNLNEEHPQIENKIINRNYYGSTLNKFSAENCRTDIVINNIDLIINNYKDKNIKIIESKHSNEKLSIGQEILLKNLSKLGIKTYVVYGDYPFDSSKIYSFQTKEIKLFNKKELINFLNY